MLTLLLLVFTKNNLIDISQSDYGYLKNKQEGTHLFGAMHDLSNSICLCRISGIFYSPATHRDIDHKYNF